MGLRTMGRRFSARKSMSMGLLGLAALMLAGGCASGGGETAAGVAVSPRVAEFLSDAAVRVLSAPEAVESYRLEPALVAQPAAAPGTVAGYRWKARGAPRAPAELAAFLPLVLDDTSYDFGIAKKCVMVPEYAFRFRRGEESVVVLVAFNCALWKFVTGDSAKVEDFDPVRDRLKAIVATVFDVD